MQWHRNQLLELSQESIHQIVQGLQQAQGGTSLPSRDIPNNNANILQDEQIKQILFQKQKINNYIEKNLQQWKIC